MEVHYNLKGDQRKELVKRVVLHLAMPPTYLGAPTFAYKVGNYIVDKSGTLFCPDGEESDQLIKKLKNDGYEGVVENLSASNEEVIEEYSPKSEQELQPQTEKILPEESTNASSETEAETPPESGAETAPYSDIAHEYTLISDPSANEPTKAQESAKNLIKSFSSIDQSGVNRLTVCIPRDKDFGEDAVERLKKIVESKEEIFKKAFQAKSLPIVCAGNEQINFPWFTLTGKDGEAEAYILFIYALCKMAKESKRITATKKEETNDKFTMRIFLIRLGMIGDEHKQARKILLSHLEGNSSWKNGKPVQVANQSNSEEED